MNKQLKAGLVRLFLYLQNFVYQIKFTNHARA